MFTHLASKNSYNPRSIAKKLCDYAVTIKLLGWKPHIGQRGVNDILFLIRNGYIELPKKPESVRLTLELSNDKLTAASIFFVVGLINEQRLLEFDS